MTDARAEIASLIARPDFRRATFSGPPRNSNLNNWVRVALRPVVVRGERHVQFSYFDARKDVSKNFKLDALEAPLAELFAVGFANVHVESGTDEIDVRISKKGKVFVGRKAGTAAAPVELDHNRVKDQPLAESDRVLQVLGIATPDGKVRPTMRAKFTQINEFLKHLAVGLRDARLLELDRPLKILDCGCGSSYLTLAAHHYLNAVLKVPAELLGVDVNDDLIAKSTAKADATPGLNFACGTIGELTAEADVVVALHACDTATDDAIAQAVRSGAKLFLGAPCCHKELSYALKPPAELAPLLRDGLLRQRTADLVTDALRAAALRALGFRTDAVEFVSPEHTARNLLLRAVRTGSAIDAKELEEYRTLARFWGVRPSVGRLLPDGMRSASTEPRP